MRRRVLHGNAFLQMLGCIGCGLHAELCGTHTHPAGECVFERAPGHVLVHDTEVTVVRTVAEEGQQVRVLQPET